MSTIIGIDLGTTNYCVATIKDGKPIIIPNAEGAYITPSVISFSATGDIKIGESAKRQAVTNPQNTISSIKQFMGESYSNIKSKCGQKPYNITSKSENDIPIVEINNRFYSPQEISAMFLQKAKKDTEAFLGESVQEVVITVPAYFNAKQRRATKEAGEMAGWKVRRIISEPTAAALAYGLGKGCHKEENIAVFHMGGGTFDISILELGNDVLEVKSTNGNTHLGGDDFDEVIVNWLIEDFQKTNGIDLLEDPTALQRIKEAAETAKIELSSSQETNINLPYITCINGIFKHIEAKLTREKFEELCSNLIQSIIEPCDKAMNEAGIDYIHKVILVGGATRIPAVQKKVEEVFGIKPSKCVNPDEAVAIGAAIQGSAITGEVKNLLLLDVVSLSLGIEIENGVMAKIIKANTTIPIQHTEIFTTTKDNQTSIEIHVLQGESKKTNQNLSLGRFTLDGLPPAPKGVPQIEVTFDVDHNGLLSVSACDIKTRKTQKMSFRY